MSASDVSGLSPASCEPPQPPASLSARTLLCTGERDGSGITDVVVQGKQQRVLILGEETLQNLDVRMGADHQTLRLEPQCKVMHILVHDHRVGVELWHCDSRSTALGARLVITGATCGFPVSA